MSEGVGEQARGLSARQAEVVALIPGYTNKQIGRLLGISQETVAHHLQAATVRLDARNRTHLYIRAAALGEIPTPTWLRVARARERIADASSHSQ